MMNGEYEVISELKNHLNFQQNIKIKSKLFRYIGNDSLKDAFWRILPGVAFIKTPFGALILSILVISIFASYSLGFGTSYSSGDQYYSNWVLGVRVSSYSQQGEPEFMVFVKDRGGTPLKVIYNVYAWMPDGGFEHLGFYGVSALLRLIMALLEPSQRCGGITSLAGVIILAWFSQEYSLLGLFTRPPAYMRALEAFL